MTRWRIFGVLRLAAAVAGIVALSSRFVYGLGFSSFASLNFFGYLTVQSNMVAVVANVIGGVIALRARGEPSWLPGMRVSVATFLIVAGIVFTILVTQSASRGYLIEVPWSDRILHYWLPAFLLVDWLVGPGSRRAPWRTLAIVVGYPLGWGAVTLVRGSIVGWYPYFFMDPAQVSGPGEIAGYGAAALALFAGVATALLLAPAVEERVVDARVLQILRERRRTVRARSSPDP